jgi:hypothetical protein
LIERVNVFELVYDGAKDERRVDNDKIKIELSTKLGRESPRGALGKGL